MHKTKRVEYKCNAECDIRDMYARVVTTQHVYTKHLSDGYIYSICGIYKLMRFPDIVEATSRNRYNYFAIICDPIYVMGYVRGMLLLN